MGSCFFTGHRYFSIERDNVIEDLTSLFHILAESGFTDFYCGGAQGWDTYCGYAIGLLKKYYPQVKLHLVLPCSPEKQTLNWKDDEKAEYNVLRKIADSIEIVSDDNDKNCMKKRNARLVELGDICICYFNKKDTRSGTAQTVRMAEKANKIIFNMCFLIK